MLSLMKATSTVASNNLTWVRHSSAPACVLPYLSPKEAVLGWWSFMQNSAHADVGPCPKVHACGTLHSTSYGYRWKFPGAWACRNTLNYPPLKRCIQRLKFYDKSLWLFWKLPHLLLTNAIFCGHGNWGLWLKSLYLLESPWKNLAPYDESF